MNNLLSSVDQTMDVHLGTVVVCGGDLNQLNIKQFEQLTGWNALVDFPTRGESRLDNCLSNRAELFGRCRPFTMLIKSDHIGVVLPAGTKLRPVRRKVKIRDQREDLYKGLVGHGPKSIMVAVIGQSHHRILSLAFLGRIFTRIIASSYLLFYSPCRRLFFQMKGFNK